MEYFDHNTCRAFETIGWGMTLFASAVAATASVCLWLSLGLI